MVPKLVKPPHNPRWNTRKADWPLFRESITSQLRETPRLNDLNEQDARRTAAFHTAANQAIPLTKMPKKHYKDWWYHNKNVQEYKHTINQAKKLHRRHNTDTTCALLKAATRTEREGTKAIRNNKWIDWCASLDPHTNISKMWKQIRTI
ncbi:hypothetical protein E2C01_024975 [Portunus trituberculatus]|uniref:Uncharacterized protein n=1 Tax=Portunus trituberculatus TaxID=210409 RepID=A0A5B7EEE6_PORTR|nr:hypothetical protein [Portunus trituberculatus]